VLWVLYFFRLDQNMCERKGAGLSCALFLKPQTIAAGFETNKLAGVFNEYEKKLEHIVISQQDLSALMTDAIATKILPLPIRMQVAPMRSLSLLIILLAPL